MKPRAAFLVSYRLPTHKRHQVNEGKKKIAPSSRSTFVLGHSYLLAAPRLSSRIRCTIAVAVMKEERSLMSYTTTKPSAQWICSFRVDFPSQGCKDINRTHRFRVMHCISIADLLLWCNLNTKWQLKTRD